MFRLEWVDRDLVADVVTIKSSVKVGQVVKDAVGYYLYDPSTVNGLLCVGSLYSIYMLIDDLNMAAWEYEVEQFNKENNEE